MEKNINNILEFISSWGNSEFSSSLLSEVLDPETILKKAMDEEDPEKRTSLLAKAKSRKERVGRIRAAVDDPSKFRNKGRFKPERDRLDSAEKGKDILSRVGNDPEKIEARRQQVDLDTIDPEKESRRQEVFQNALRKTSRTSTDTESDQPKETDNPSSPPTKKPSRWSSIRSALGKSIEDIEDISVAAPLIRIGTGLLRGAAAATRPYTGKDGPRVSFPGVQRLATDSVLLAQARRIKRQLRNTTDPEEQRRLRARLRQYRFGGVLGGGTFGGGDNS